MQVLRMKDVSEKTTLPRSSIYEKINKGEFSKPFKLGAKTIAWLESDINEWFYGVAKNNSLDARGG